MPERILFSVWVTQGSLDVSYIESSFESEGVLKNMYLK